MTVDVHRWQGAPSESGQVETFYGIQSLQAISAARDDQFLVDYNCAELQSSAAHGSYRLPGVIAQRKCIYGRRAWRSYGELITLEKITNECPTVRTHFNATLVLYMYDQDNILLRNYPY